MNGLERLEAEVLEMNNNSVSAVFNYLKTRKDLYEKFDNEEKSIAEMYEYIYNRSKKFSKNNVAMVQDNLVLAWAVTYFTKTNEDLGIKPKKVMPPSADEVIKKEAKKKAVEEAKAKKKDDQISMFEEVKE